MVKGTSCGILSNPPKHVHNTFTKPKKLSYCQKGVSFSNFGKGFIFLILPIRFIVLLYLPRGFIFHFIHFCREITHGLEVP
jgi:hypothetical protein